MGVEVNMGMFDEVEAPCRKCDGHAVLQSKAGERILAVYRIGRDEIPMAIAGDLIGESGQCLKCKEPVAVRGTMMLWTE